MEKLFPGCNEPCEGYKIAMQLVEKTASRLNAPQPLTNGNLGRVEVASDEMAEKLDDMADICRYWKYNRDQGRHPKAIRAALILLAKEVVAIDGAHNGLN